MTVNGRRQFMLTFLFSYYNLELEGVAGRIVFLAGAWKGAKELEVSKIPSK